MNTGSLLEVTLEGDAKSSKAQGNTEGYYTLNSTLVNGKQNWIQVQGSGAIWYNETNDDWMIGDKENLGSSTCCYLHSWANNAKSPEDATTWMYVNDDGEWLPTYNIFGSLGMY